MFIVSHDRYFINRMADQGDPPDAGRLHDRPGELRRVPGTDGKAGGGRGRGSRRGPAAKENAYKQRKEQESAKRKLAGRIRRTEEEIAAAEEAVAALHLRLESEEVTADYERLLEVTGQLEAESRPLDELMEQWEQLQLEAEA